MFTSDVSSEMPPKHIRFILAKGHHVHVFPLLGTDSILS